ncbi:MAG: co-chaperone HscB [Cellulomonas sp.]|nr:co-chaperone HscB [Cellulomonas sp.]
MPDRADPVVVDYLVRAAREFRRGGWVFTGFHWPVLAGQLAHRIDGEPFQQAFEAGATTHGPGSQTPTSTTDYPSYANALGFVGGTTDILLAMGRRFDRVVLDASNIDVLGRVNSSIIGDAARPRVRLPGGGGAPDVAARARELVWLSGGADLTRVQRRLDHVTAAPGPGSLVRMHTRWGIAVLGDSPSLEEIADVAAADDFVAHLESLGVDTSSPTVRPPTTSAETQAATELLVSAAERGYQVAASALAATKGSS